MSLIGAHYYLHTHLCKQNTRGALGNNICLQKYDLISILCLYIFRNLINKVIKTSLLQTITKS